MILSGTSSSAGKSRSPKEQDLLVWSTKKSKRNEYAPVDESVTPMPVENQEASLSDKDDNHPEFLTGVSPNTEYIEKVLKLFFTISRIKNSFPKIIGLICILYNKMLPLTNETDKKRSKHEPI